MPQVKKSNCNCTGEPLTQKSYDNFLFHEMQQANKRNTTLAVIFRGTKLVTVSMVVADTINAKIYAKIEPPIMKKADIIHYFSPF